MLVQQKSKTLPLPDAETLAISQALNAELQVLCARKGYLTFAEYMHAVLYTPRLGYYAAGSYKFHRGGDFTTAPELTPLFAQCLARQALGVFQELQQQQQEITVFELGAGSGVLARDFIQYLSQHHPDCLPERYFILEVSAELRDRQQTLLRESVPNYFNRIEWLDQWPGQPVHGVIIANEVMDALAVMRFCYHQRHWQEMVVIWDHAKSQWRWDLKSLETITLETDRPWPKAQFGRNTAHLFEHLDPDVPYYSEYHWQLPAWLNSLSMTLATGLILLIDYGFPASEYYHPERQQGTLMCHYQHHAHADPFWLPGLQDITAHVNFSQVAMAAQHAGLLVAGYCHQAAFLMSLGILEQTSDDDVATSYQAAQAIKRLLLPSEMGELFKVMALTRGLNQPLRGFHLLNQVERL